MATQIRIIGKGCYFCQQMRKIAEELVEELKLQDATIEQTDDMEELLAYGVVNPPALVVNGRLKLMGRVLVRSHVRQAIAEEAGGESGAGRGERREAKGGEGIAEVGR
jgi:small redox-active disulfide protein 2